MAIRTRLLLSMLLIVGVYTLLAVVVVHYTVRASAFDTVEAVLAARIQVVVEALDDASAEMERVTANAAHAEELAPLLMRERGAEQPAQETLDWIAQHTRADAVFLLDVYGGIALQAGDPEAIPDALVVHPAVQGALERGIGSGWLALDGQPLLVAMAPVSRGYERAGLLLAVDTGDAEMLEELKRSAGAEVMLLGEEVLQHTMPAVVDLPEHAESRALLTRSTAGENRPHHMALFGGRYIVVEKRLTPSALGDDLGVALLMPSDAIRAVTREARHRLGLVGLLLSGLAVVLALVLTRNLVRPLEDLVADTRRAAEAEPSQASPDPTLPEVAVLSDALNDLVRQHRRQLARTEARARHEREQELGHGLQSSLESEIVEVGAYDTAVGTWRIDDAAGDVVELLPGGDGSLWVVLGDVAARGVTAAAVATLLRGATAAAVALKPDDPPGAVLRAVDRALTERIERAGWEPTFVALRLLRLSPDGRYTFAGAHEEMVLLPAEDGASRRLDWHGTWIGLGPGAQADDPDGSGLLEPGDTLVLVTDGILAGQDDSGRLFGSDRVDQVLDQARGHPARVVRDRMINTWARWSVVNHDDATVVVIRRRAGGADVSVG